MSTLRVLPRETYLNEHAETDEVLMARLVDGDLAAFDALYERHASRLRVFIARFIGDRDAADDLLQEVFLKVYRSPKSFDPKAKFLTWVYAVTRNACIDWLRRKKIRFVPIGPSDDDDDGMPGIDPATPEYDRPEDKALSAELADHVATVTDALSPKLREVFVLCALQGLSYEEAADVIGCPVKTVSSRLSRARDSFFSKFKDYLGDASLEAAPRG
jgi:RNA polymerase sigma-70 factor (ECF subfamily)